MKTVHSLVLISLFFLAGCGGGTTAETSKPYHKYHIAVEADWTVDESKVAAGGQIFKEAGSGIVEIDAIFEDGNLNAVKQTGYSRLKSYDLIDPSCHLIIPSKYMEGNQYTAIYSELTLDGTTLTLSGFDGDYPESITVAMDCGTGTSKPFEDPGLYEKRFLGVFSAPEGNNSFILNAEVKEWQVKDISFGGQYIGNLEFTVTDLGRYTKEELKVMGEL